MHCDALLVSTEHTTFDRALALPGAHNCLPCRIYSSVPGGGYNFTSGTSIATPFVSGSAALLLAVAQDRLGLTLTAQELKQRLMDSVEVLLALKGRSATGGRLRTDWALQALLGQQLSPASACFARKGDKKKCKKASDTKKASRRQADDGGVAAAQSMEAELEPAVAVPEPAEAMAAPAVAAAPAQRLVAVAEPAVAVAGPAVAMAEPAVAAAPAPAEAAAAAAPTAADAVAAPAPTPASKRHSSRRMGNSLPTF
jgi:hypothetical protein